MVLETHTCIAQQLVGATRGSPRHVYRYAANQGQSNVDFEHLEKHAK